MIIAICVLVELLFAILRIIDRRPNYIAMDKSTTTNQRKVKNNSRYQKDIDRSFAVIYHNLKRIQDDKQSQERLTRRSNSEPQITGPNPTLQHKKESIVSRERSYSATTINHDPRSNKRRVSFSTMVSEVSMPEIHQ